MRFAWLRGGHQAQQRKVISHEDQALNQVIKECYCPNGHSILTDQVFFSGYSGLTLKLRSDSQEGLLSISPVIGDRDREFIGFVRYPGEVVDICCPTCSEPFPVYNQCDCGAHLVALFTSLNTSFSQCVGICQRIGCLHSELISERNLRLYSRKYYF